ncbi:hypothetical protein ACFQHQ_17655, partial [Zunongwangia atlantica 22II14-10F7]
ALKNQETYKNLSYSINRLNNNKDHLEIKNDEQKKIEEELRQKKLVENLKEKVDEVYYDIAEIRRNFELQKKRVEKIIDKKQNKLADIKGDSTKAQIQIDIKKEKERIEELEKEEFEETLKIWEELKLYINSIKLPEKKIIEKLNKKVEDIWYDLNSARSNSDFSILSNNDFEDFYYYYHDYYDSYFFKDKSDFNDQYKIESEIIALETERMSILSEIERALKKNPLWSFEAEDIQLDINDGYIEHIVVLGKINGISIPDEHDIKLEQLKVLINENPDWKTNVGKQLKFKNAYPLGFSSSDDFDNFKRSKIAVYTGNLKEFEMDLEDIFPNYVQSLANDRLDFSPKDQTVVLPEPDKKSGYKLLTKDKSSKLFQVAVLSDFNGLNGSNPNGVLQFNFRKEIPLHTQRYRAPIWKYKGHNLGFFNYIAPELNWSRLNSRDQDQTLALSYVPVFNGGVIDSLAYTTHLNLLRYENIGVGAILNIFTYSIPAVKIRFEMNLGGKFGHTYVLDPQGETVQQDGTTINRSKDYDLNTWRWYPELVLKLRPEERYGADVRLRPIRFNALTDHFSTISSEQQFKSNLSDNNQWLNQIEINAHFSPSAQKENRFFFRYRFTNSASWEYNGYSEIQVGYSIQLKI